jgi:hypothetical protein
LFKYILPLIILLITLYACIEEYYPPNVKDKSSNQLTVNGIIYNDDSLKTIILSRSKGAWEPDSVYEMVSGARVTIVDDLGNSIAFFQSEGGIYQSDFQPQYERTYQLYIIDEFGTEYQSESVRMEFTPEIDSIYWKMKIDPYSEDEAYQGIDIRVSTHDEVSQYSYFNWDWTETWEIRARHRTIYEYVDGEVLITNRIPYTCWMEESTADIIIGSTESLSENQIMDKIIQVIPFTQNKLHVRYSILVRQYALDKEAYNFWLNLQNTTETSGSLFDRQPTELRGNITNLSNPQEPVLGYFDIYEVKKKRLFIDRDEIPIVRGITDGYSDCELDTIGIGQIEEYAMRGYHFYQPLRFGPYIIQWIVVREDCSDCRTRGSAIKPIFWE